MTLVAWVNSGKGALDFCLNPSYISALVADVFTKEERSRCMAAIRSSGNKGTELRLVEIFRRNRVAGWRRKARLPGKPDFVFPKARVALFVDGCFWHSCPLHGRKPGGNSDYWAMKLHRNKRRDRIVASSLRKAGWTVLRVWEHALRNEEQVARRVQRVLERKHCTTGTQ